MKRWLAYYVYSFYLWLEPPQPRKPEPSWQVWLEGDTCPGTVMSVSQMVRTIKVPMWPKMRTPTSEDSMGCDLEFEYLVFEFDHAVFREVR